MTPKRRLLLCAALSLLSLPAASQGKHGLDPNMVPKSLSLTYANNIGPMTITTTVANMNDAMNGASYNGGSAIVYKVQSDKPYSIRISGESGLGPSVTYSMRPIDIRDYIYFQLMENNTGGFPGYSQVDPAGARLGATESTVLVNCPPTLAVQGSVDPESGCRTFSLKFTLKAGYAVPPGYYSTNLTVTATYE